MTVLPISGERLFWLGDPIDEIDDAALGAARKYLHLHCRSVLGHVPQSLGHMEVQDKMLAQVTALEAECLRRGWTFISPLGDLPEEWREEDDGE